MIIDSTAIVDLAVGVDRRIIEVGDVQIALRSEVGLQVPLIKTTRSVRDTAIVQNESAFLHLSQLRVNQAALTTAIMTLSKGLWEIQVALTSKFNWLVAPGTLGGVRIEMVYSGDTNTLIYHLATIGTFTNYVVFNYLLNETAVLQFVTDITGVGQNSDARVSVNAVRRL